MGIFQPITGMENQADHLAMVEAEVMICLKKE